MKTAAVLFICWRSTVHSVISPAEKYHKTNAYLVGPFVLWEVLSVVSPTLHAVFTKHPKQEVMRLKTVQVLAEEKKDAKLWNVVDENPQ